MFLTSPDELRGAILSPDRGHRMVLWRIWDESQPYVAFVGLNPSTADEREDDPTIRRCRGYAKQWGYGGLVMLNLFSFRATDPSELPLGNWGADAIVRNDEYLCWFSAGAALTVCAWGNHGAYMGMGKRTWPMFRRAHYLSRTVSGQPGHPLYLPSNLTPIPWGEDAKP